MLDHIAILNNKSFGQLAEMLLFYGKVTIFVNEDILRSLFKQVDPKTLIPFLEEHEKNIKLRYTTWGVWTHYNNPHYKPNTISFSLGDEETLGVDEPYLDYLSRTSSLDTPNGYTTDKKLTQRLLRLITTDSVGRSSFESLFDEDTMRTELPKFVQDYAYRFPQEGLSNIPKDISFTTNKREIQIKTEKVLSWTEYLCIHQVVSNYIQTLSNLPIWASISSEIMTGEENAFTIQTQVNRVIRARIRSPRVINAFQEVFIPDARTIKEVINGGDKSFADFLKVYERGMKFKDWILGQPADSNLLKEYYRNITKDTWIDKLPNKTARWMIFTGAGIALDTLGAGGVGTLAGITLGAFDTFILDSIVKGWKPNQYVDKDLKKFLSD